jgi:S1-C subfamily serine protease
MRTYWIAGLFVLLAVLSAGCGRAAKLIPGDSRTRTPVPTGTPTPTVTAEPILITPTLQLGGTTPAASATTVPDQQLAQSVVQIEMLDGTTQPSKVVRNGSGVVIDQAQRLILTSYPLVDPARSDGSPAYTMIAIGSNLVPGSEPQLAYRAEIISADPSVDLAVLRVTALIDGSPLGSGPLDLPAVRIDQSSQAGTGDTLRIFGEPGLDPSGAPTSQVLTVTQAMLTGFRGSPFITGRAWLKTDAQLPYGDQGGPAFDRTGGLVGVLVQPIFNPAAPVAEVRPSDLAADIIARARTLGAATSYRAPLIAHATGATDGIWVSTPTFAQNAIDGPFGRDLFDYRNRFASHTVAVYYEFVAQGIPAGTVVEERWYRDGVFQDQISSSYPWNEGGFGAVSDRLTTPNPAGLPDGRWRLEVWAGGTLRSTATALIGVEPRTPQITAQDVPFASTATADRQPSQPVAAGSDQILFFFNYEGMEEARQIRWLVFHNGQAIYQSAELPWTGGASGRWWVGYKDTGPLTGGLWEFELHIDGHVVLTKEISL